MARSSVSAKDVAALAGVSRTAVSRSFTPGAPVSAETRAKVFSAAEQLGYHVNHLARGLLRAESGLVALIAAEIETPYRSALLAALSGRLQQEGKVALLINSDRSDGSVARALRQAISYRTDAAIVLSGMPDVSLAETCLRNGMRLVLINRDEERPGAVRIRLDDEAAGRSAFVALVAAGCRRIALATSRAGTPSLVGRERGFLAAAKTEGVAVTVEATGATSYQTGLDLGTALMTRPDRPDGVFCTTDLLACGLMDAARHRFGAAIPRDLCVIGFDDIPQAAWEAYALTTFRQPLDALAGVAVGALAPGAPDQTRMIAPQLIWRGTVRRAGE